MTTQPAYQVRRIPLCCAQPELVYEFAEVLDGFAFLCTRCHSVWPLERVKQVAWRPVPDEAAR